MPTSPTPDRPDTGQVFDTTHRLIFDDEPDMSLLPDEFADCFVILGVLSQVIFEPTAGHIEVDVSLITDDAGLGDLSDLAASLLTALGTGDPNLVEGVFWLTDNSDQRGALVQLAIHAAREIARHDSVDAAGLDALAASMRAAFDQDLARRADTATP